MPQLQKAIPLAVAPFKKFLRVVIPLCLPGSPESAFPFDRSIFRRPFLHFFVEQIAKPNAQEQSFSQGLLPVIRKKRSRS
jgi:hypothetical protein